MSLLLPHPHPSQAVFCARRASKLAASLLGILATRPESLETSMLRHLRAIEAIEARIAAGDLSQDDAVSLVALGHETLNEIHRLHLREEMRRIYVTRPGRDRVSLSPA